MKRLEDLSRKRRKNKDDDQAEAIDMMDSILPWKCATDDQPMMVDLLFGKTFLHGHGASKQGEILIQSIKEGQLIQVEARTDVGDRQSLRKWTDHRCLDLIVSSCQILQRNDMNNDIASIKESLDGSNSTSSSSDLSLHALFSECPTINIVDDLESLDKFASDVIQQLNDLSINGTALIGIDCEWRPSEFMDEKDQPQPVLVLQISFHSLRSIHLVDLQQCISTPLQAPGTPMNEIESKLNKCLSQLFESPVLIKVG